MNLLVEAATKMNQYDWYVLNYPVVAGHGFVAEKQEHVYNTVGLTMKYRTEPMNVLSRQLLQSESGGAKMEELRYHRMSLFFTIVTNIRIFSRICLMVKAKVARCLYIDSLMDKYKKAKKDGSKKVVGNIKRLVCSELQRRKALRAFHTMLLLRQLREVTETSSYTAMHQAILRVDKLEKEGRIRARDMLKGQRSSWIEHLQ